MCVIILQPVGTYLTKEEANRAWTTNPDGGGYAFFDGEFMKVKKFEEFREFWRSFENDRSHHRAADFLIHMRIATHGTTDLYNVHPFWISNDAVMAHNGIIHQVPDYKDGRSDTRVFIDEVLPELPEDWYAKEYLKEMVGDWLGSSKLAILTPTSWHLVNERRGEWANGMWFSNRYHVKGKLKTSTFPASPVKTTPYFVSTWDEDDILCEAQLYGPALRRKEDKYNWPLTDTEIEQLVEARETLGIGRYPFVESVTEQVFECLGCMGMLDAAGVCDCFDTGCADCLQFTAFCTCETHGHQDGPALILSMDDFKKRRAAVAKESL
jgi:hypothetical protein